jgi:hypothetical protein
MEGEGELVGYLVVKHNGSDANGEYVPSEAARFALTWQERRI